MNFVRTLGLVTALVVVVSQSAGAQQDARLTQIRDDATREVVRQHLGAALARGVPAEPIMAKALEGDFSNATDLADCLVEKGVPFREAHAIVGKIVNFCLANGRTLESLNAQELKNFNAAFDTETPARLKHVAAMEARQTPGGTSSLTVAAQLQQARSCLAGV